MFMIKVLVIFVLAVALSNGDEPNLKAGTIEVTTSTGIVRGSYGERSNGNSKTLYWFRRIPFAEPPVGDLRFEAPVPKKRWSGVLDVTQKPDSCVQGSNPPRGSEDCLYLKVYTETKPNPNNKLPVLVWIYGGGFFAGAADFDDHSPDYLLDQNVIVVAVHYRLGLLGFISTGDTVAPGNNGIRDQILALKWIKENIQQFGGDPDKITIWGQSAGAASVGYLLQIEETKGLFSQAILNSGTTLCAWSLGPDVPGTTRRIASDLKVSTSNSASILAGLKKVDIETLQNTVAETINSQLINNNPLNGLVFGPVAEPNHPNAIITGRSHERLSNGNFHHVPLLVGYTSVEGLFDTLPSIFRVWLAQYDIFQSNLVPAGMNLGSVASAILGRTIKTQYFGSSSILSSNTNIMRLVSDTQFEKPIVESIRLYSQKTKVYAYHFGYEGPLWGRTSRKFDGVGHTEDLGYLFDYGYTGSAADYLARDRMVRLWTNFVKSGNPTPSKESLLQNVHWPENTGNDELKFLEVNKNLSVVDLPNAEKINFWRRIYNEHGRPPYSTY